MNPLDIIKGLERRGGVLRVQEERICLTRPEGGLSPEERRLLAEEPEAVIAILSGPEFAFWRRWARDPRPDLGEDSALWSLLLMDLYERGGGPPDPLLGALHFLRCLGAQLVEINPWKVSALPADPEGTQGLAYKEECLSAHLIEANPWKLGAAPASPAQPTSGRDLLRRSADLPSHGARTREPRGPTQEVPTATCPVEGRAHRRAVASGTADQPYIICADGCPYTVIAGEIPLDEWEAQWKRLAIDALSAARMALRAGRV